MASQNGDPVTASVVSRKRAQPSKASAWGSTGKRLQQELMTLMISGNKGISAFPESYNLFKWVGTIHGEAGTVSEEDLRRKLFPEFHSCYPSNATFKFLTLCYHKVATQGNHCLDILKDKWFALYDVRTILSIQSLLEELNICNPLNIHAASLWKNPTAFNKHLQKEVSSQEP
uniref:UBC core domain-containing protein n=1 Tax=Loxodonta africana TaxID=9785 RepID=G3U933_LOXAF